MKKNSITTCVIPAAGAGSRWLSASSRLPKEMLPILGKPAIQWIVEEAVESGCSKIIVVVNKKKLLIKDYLKNKIAFPPRIKVSFVNQEKQLGLAHALLLTRKYVSQKKFAVILPDMPAIYNEPIIPQITNSRETIKKARAIFSLAKYPENNMLTYGKSLLKKRKKGIYEIRHVCPRENNGHNHRYSSLHFSGRFIYDRSCFKLIEKSFEDINNGKEIDEVTPLKQVMIEENSVFGVEVIGKVYDIGTPDAYLETKTRISKLKSD